VEDGTLTWDTALLTTRRTRSLATSGLAASLGGWGAGREPLGQIGFGDGCYAEFGAFKWT